MAAEPQHIPLVNGEKEEENNGNENENERIKHSVELKSGGKKEEPPLQEKPHSQSQSWSRPQNRPLLQQQHQQNPHHFQQQDISYQGDSQERRKSVTFGPGVRRDFPPENRLPIQQGVVIRRPSPWAVLRAKLPAGEHLPVLRPGVSNEHIIQRMQNPEAATRPQGRPPISRPGSQESVRPPYIQRSDSVVGRPPSSPRPSPSPIRPSSRSSSSSKDEEEDVTVNEIRNQSSMMRPTSGQKGPGPQIINPLLNQTPTMAQSPIIQIANHPPNMQPPGQIINQLPRTQQSPIPPNIQPQTQNALQQHHQAPTPQTGAPPLIQTQSVTSQNVSQGPLSSNKSQTPIVSNQTIAPQPQVQGIQSQNLPTQQPQNSMQQNLSSPHQQQSQQPQGQIPTTQTQAQISTSNVTAPQIQAQPPKNSATANQNSGQSILNSGPQTPSVPPAQPNSTQNSVPPSPVGPRRPTPARNTNTTQPSSPPKSSVSQRQDGEAALNKEENRAPQEPEFIPEIKKTQDKMNHNKTIEEQKEKVSPKKMNGLQDKPLHMPPVVVDATLKRPIDLKSSSVAGKAEETEKTAKENEPPKAENSKTDSTPTKAQEPAVVNGNHESPKKPKAAPPKKLGTAQSPLKSPNKPLPKTPETPGTADKKKVPMNKVQVGAAPSPNLKSVKSKIGSLENAKHKPGGGKVKIEHRKLNFNVSPKIEAKNDAYSPGGGDKKIQQVKLQWNAKPKVGSLDNAAHKPGGGDKKIESVKLDFKDKAKPKVGSKDNIKHIAGGGTVKNSDEHLDGDQCDIEDQKLEISAQSKVGSMDNVKHRPGGGEKKIFDDKEYLKQMATTSTDSLNQSPVHMPQTDES